MKTTNYTPTILDAITMVWPVVNKDPGELPKQHFAQADVLGRILHVVPDTPDERKLFQRLRYKKWTLLLVLDNNQEGLKPARKWAFDYAKQLESRVHYYDLGQLVLLIDHRPPFVAMPKFTKHVTQTSHPRKTGVK